MASRDRSGRVSPVGIYLRGVAMGAADLVPGVSGGTIAFITGIYERLLSAIGAVTGEAFSLVLSRRWTDAWRAIDGTFLLTLFAGILTSIALLARVVGYLLEAHPILLWSFFCGLILASSLHLMRQVGNWRALVAIAFVMGATLALAFGLLKPVVVAPSLPLVFMAGAIAICAMILPGISGSFLLVLMGLYAPILAAVREFQLGLLLMFACGCLVGLLSFARLLSWLLRRFHDTMMALLTGFLFGSLTMVWPWRVVDEWFRKPSGEQVALSQRNVLPATYEQLMSQDPQTAIAVSMVVLGFLLVWVLERQSMRAAHVGTARL